MPICVAGMHRSGTSLVARLLAASGVYVGSPGELVAPAPDNPEGFGESLPFLRLNDAVLARLGGFWDRPPAMPPGWAVSPRLSNLRREAATLVARFRGQEPWFWKDPRNSLTVAFWREVIPELRVIVCVRSPQEVVASLERRGGPDVAAGWALWLAYNRRVLAEAPAERLVVTHYEAYLFDAPAELRRVVRELGLPITPGAIAQACAMVSPRPAGSAGGGGAIGAIMPAEVEALYRELCAAAGPVCRRALAQPGTRSGPTAARTSPEPEQKRERPVLWAVKAARRVWRQEGARTLGRVVALATRRAAVRGWDALGRIRSGRPHGNGGEL
jgi:sulfotransferase family protein